MVTKKRGFELEGNDVPSVDSEKVKAFTKGASDKIVEQDSINYPWLKFDPKAKPTSGINLRLNNYQLSLIRFIAEREDRSQQYIIKKILVEGLEEATK